MARSQFINVDTERPSSRRFALFEYGFRPFFLLAAIHAALAVPVWVGLWRGDVGWQPPIAANLWHGHEMIFGFAVAALAGFMLTAVPNWTGEKAIRGPKLMLLVGVWAAGRMAAYLPWPDLYAFLDLAFLPLLALILGPGIILRAGRRNGVLVAILLVLALVNSAVHFDGWGVTVLSASWALQVAVSIFALLIGIIGGRIVPAFTQGGMKMAGFPFAITGNRFLDVAAILSLLANLLAVGFQLPAPIAGAIALLAAICNLVRFWRWQGWKTWPVPLVWVLHLGYGWLIVGLLLGGLSAFLDQIPATMGLHALTAGSFSTMILAVMSRASLGHTGRQLVANRKTAAAYALLSLAALARVTAPLAGGFETTLIESAALLWSGAFLIFGVQYLPILLLPRPDGRPG
jgi:uncharacterized protein involved in response to NO